MGTAFDLPKDIAEDSRYFPTVIGALILGLLLLFHENLSDRIKLYLIPSLAMYIASTALLAYLQTMLREREILQLKKTKKTAIHNTQTRDAVENVVSASIDPEAHYTGIPNRQFRAIVVSHFLLLAGLIAYNLWRGSL
jgi:hypothetical protein